MNCFGKLKVDILGLRLMCKEANGEIDAHHLVLLLLDFQTSLSACDWQ